MALVHHDLCFGCGQTNLFGMLLEVERVDADREPAEPAIRSAKNCPQMRLASRGRRAVQVPVDRAALIAAPARFVLARRTRRA